MPDFTVPNCIIQIGNAYFEFQDHTLFITGTTIATGSAYWGILSPGSNSELIISPAEEAQPGPNCYLIIENADGLKVIFGPVDKVTSHEPEPGISSRGAMT